MRTALTTRFRLLCTAEIVVASLGIVPGLRAEIVPVKINWVVGKGKIGTEEISLTYRDAHLQLCTRGDLWNFTPASITLGGFSNSDSTPVLGDPEDCLTVDWSLNPGESPLTGEHSVGFSFEYDNKGNPLINDIKVMQASVTGVTAPDAGLGSELNKLPVAGPLGLRDDRSHSVDWWFRNDYPAMAPPITATDVAFFLSPVEPAVSDLSDAGLASLGASLLHVEPDFSLPSGSDHFAHVLGVGAGDWLVARETSSWTDPVLSTIAGQPVTVLTTSYLATRIVPEPSSFCLAGLAVASGLIAVVRHRKRFLHCRA